MATKAKGPGSAGDGEVAGTKSALGNGPSTMHEPPRGAEVSNLEIVRQHFDDAAERLGLSDDLRTVFWTSYREVSVQIPVKLSDGSVRTYSGYRIQHNGARGPYKGGVR